MADTPTHILSSIPFVILMPSTSMTEKVLFVAGTILPDLIFTPYIIAIAKEAKKNLDDLTEEDFVSFGYSTPKIRFMKHIYYISHGLPFTLLIFALGRVVPSITYLGFGFLLHVFYDLFFHKYDNDNFLLKPFYPPLNFKYRYGITNGWRMKLWQRALLWAIHIVAVILLVLYVRNVNTTI